MVPLNAIAPDTIAVLIDLLRSRFDYVVVDLPRALVEWVAPVLGRADRLALVTDTSVNSVRQAKRLIDFYHEDNAGLAIELIVSRQARPIVKSPQVKEAERVLGAPFACWLPDQPREARKAADMGRPVVELHPSAKLSRAIGKLAAATVAASSSVNHKSK
jgi:Flp pilus assembly CpaE family ATPase